MGVSPEEIVVRRAHGEEVFVRGPRPVVVTHVAQRTMGFRPAIRLPRSSLRARAFWFDHDTARAVALGTLHRSGWELRPRRWPLVATAAAAIALAAILRSSDPVWLVLVGFTVLGCAVQLVRNERAVHRMGSPRPSGG